MQLRWFDATTSARLALVTLRRSLGSGRAMRVVASIVRRAALEDPMRTLPVPTTPNEAMSAAQLRSVLLLDAALRDDLMLPAEEVHALVRTVMRTSGAAFLLRFFAGFTDADWIAASPAERTAFADGVATRVFNARIEAPVATSDSLSFEVSRCLFVDWLGALGRLDLAPLFCEVDAALVERDDVPMELERPTTIAGGGDRCRFRFVRVSSDA